MAVSSLNYVGPIPTPGEGADVMNILNGTSLLTSGPVNETQASSAVATAAGGYATTVQTNNTCQGYALPSYYQTQDALYMPNAALGQPNGVATLNTASPPTIPLTQCPSLGAGYIFGPFGPTATATGSTGSSPLKIADFNIGVQSVSTFQPMVYMSVLALSASGLPVLEVRISNGQAAYGSQTLVAMGVGRQGYSDPQTVLAIPVAATTGQTPSGLTGGTYNIWLSAWLYDGAAQTVTISTGGIVSAGAFFMRGAA
jgi:hypothetical protein